MYDPKPIHNQPLDTLSKLDQARAMKKRQEQIDAMRLATPEPPVQSFRNLYFTHAGRRMTLTKWARYLGLDYGTLKARYKSGKRGDALFSMNPYVRMPNTPALPPDYVKKPESGKRVKAITNLDDNGTPIINYDPLKHIGQ